jgi:hypothetical protein
MIDRTELWLFVGTFVLGMCAGVYLYVAGFAAQYSALFTSTERETEISFSLTGEQYGDCDTSETGCVMFRVFADRDFRVIALNGRGEVVDQREGVIPEALLENVFDVLNDAHGDDALAQYPGPPAYCTKENGGIRYLLEIPEYGTLALDACMEEVDTSRRMWRTLQQVSEYLGVTSFDASV